MEKEGAHNLVLGMLLATLAPLLNTMQRPHWWTGLERQASFVDGVFALDANVVEADHGSSP